VFGVTVSDLFDPKHDYSKGLTESIERHDMALEILDGSAQRELLYATCPRCGKPNPDGVAALQAEARSMRRYAGGFFIALAVGTFFFPGLAWFVVVLVVAFAALLIWGAVRFNKHPRKWLGIAQSIAVAAGAIAIAIFYPRASAVIPLLPAGVYLRMKPDLAKLESAKTKIRFDQPYR
jgi:hypothetical protein